MSYFISENYQELPVESDYVAKSYQEIASDYLCKFAAKDVGWLEEYDDSTFEKYVVITESGVLLAERLILLECSERKKFCSYIYNIFTKSLQKNSLNVIKM